TGLIHDETGFPSGSPKVTREAIKRMNDKIARAEDIIEVHQEFMDDAEFAVVSFGGTARTAYEAVLNVRKRGHKVGFVRLITIFPFADKIIRKLAGKVKGLVVAELNFGQLVNEVERAVAGQCPVKLCAKYDMTIFEPEEIEASINELIAEVNGNG
ncbi:MAG: 2-oxoacid:acceptor oxidoreductase subunit alpha, partial [Selenomonadaceae bacterium]|nr:2-oxoacid:acceptor oxidoreductase subunit alpha [Selenomonadaceae bacterium]